jgi:ribosomal protein S19
MNATEPASVVRRHENELLQLPNVVGVGVGEHDGKEVIKVFVTRKVPASELESHELVPTELEGYDVDVEEIGPVAAQDQ